MGCVNFPDPCVTTPLDLVETILCLARLGAALGVCLVACRFALGALEPRSRRIAEGWPRQALTGVIVGTAIWAEPFMAGGWPHALGLVPGLAAASLALAIGAAIWAFRAYALCEGVLCVIAGGALLGAAAGLSHGVTLLALRGPTEFTFDDAPFCASIAGFSATGVGAFVAYRRWPTGRGRLVAGLLLAAGALVSDLVARGALLAGAPLGRDLAGNLVAPARLAPLAAAMVFLLVAAVAWLERGPRLRRATRALAGRGNWRTSRAPSPAGTGSLRPAPVRSVAGRAAGPGRPGPPAD
jgi:NO-binding membrane sensor protein with MHYT domain